MQGPFCPDACVAKTNKHPTTANTKTMRFQFTITLRPQNKSLSELKRQAKCVKLPRSGLVDKDESNNPEQAPTTAIPPRSRVRQRTLRAFFTRHMSHTLILSTRQYLLTYN